MGAHSRRHFTLSALAFLAAIAPAWATDIEVTGLFANKAMVSINGGPPRVMSVGQSSPEGVKLISADSSGAVFEMDGQRKKVGMGQRIATSFASGAKPTVKLVADSNGHFSTVGSINGRPIRFMVDTGATMVSFSTNTARQLGIDLSGASQGAVSTAGGVVRAWKVTLDNVKVGAISLNLVEATVVDNLPDGFALLGNSFLNRLQMSREGNVLTLTQSY
ncbi:retropepsin-like aspartic protease family protein [Thiobacter aerophilum]|uniref:TIGR02281 family clan AA aspartic protease n=1 Tax=Thiobacter aerophilum TaxID=3121275 RepID=A0ABV0EJQ9_9BURK